MSNNTTVSGITSQTQYTLLDNNHKYLPRNFTFIPTVSSKSNDNDNTKTVENALNNNYYTCTALDFVYKIDVKDDLKDVVYKTENKSACVYKISSGGNDVYKYCEDKVNVNISALGDANINIGNVTVEKGEDVLKPIAGSLGCTVPSATKKITVPNDYNSLEINSPDVYFRQENNNEQPSWVTINNNIVSFSNDIKPSENIIELFDNNFTITLNKNTYSFNSMIDINLMNAYDNLTLNEPQLNLVAINLTLALRKAVTDLKQAVTDSEQAATDLELAATNLGKAATNLEQVATDLGKAATNLGKAATDLGTATNLGKAATDLKQAATDLKQAATDSERAAQYFQKASLRILNTSLSLKQYKLFDEVEGNNNNNTTYVWKNRIANITDTTLTTITNNFKECQEGVKGNEFNQYFDRLKAIYAIYNNDDNIGLMDKLKKCVVVNNTPVLKGILEYCFTINNLFKNIKMFALDKNNEMIIYKKNENTYELVYRDPSNTERILPKKDSFIPTANPTEP